MSGKILVVRLKTIDDVLVNPGIGFTTFQRFYGDVLNEGRTWTEGFPNENDSRIFTTNADIRQWLSGDSIHDESFTIPSDMPEGSYEIQTGIIDGITLEPSVKLAMDGIQADGWYSLGKIYVGKMAEVVS